MLQSTLWIAINNVCSLLRGQTHGSSNRHIGIGIPELERVVGIATVKKKARAYEERRMLFPLPKKKSASQVLKSARRFDRSTHKRDAGKQNRGKKMPMKTQT